MTIDQIMFFLFSGIIILFSVLTVTTKKILRAATYLLFVLVSTAGLYFMMHYNFLAAVQLTLYAGGIVVLIIFSILLTSQIGHKLLPIDWKKRIASLILVATGCILTIITILKFPFASSGLPPADPDIHNIGLHLMSVDKYGYVLPFEVISILLLAAMIGAIVIAKKQKD
jgi:NADH-quinone oxidoreductase subunit J